MKSSTYHAIISLSPCPLLLAATFFAPAALRAEEVAAPPATNGVARIEFATTVHDFGKVVGGQPARHEYYFTNTGTAVLKINSVNASCGCTTAGEWTREVAPGGVGQIPLQFNSGSFSGAITKTATVTCNDPAMPTVILQIKGTVWQPIEVMPSVAVLQVNSELVSNATSVVRITNHAPEALEVFEPHSSNPQFAVEVRTNTPGRLFEVVVRSVPPLNLFDPRGNITLRTSFTNIPVVGFSAMSVLQPAVIVSPPRVVIPEDQLTNNWTGRVTVRSGMNRALALSDAQVNIPGANVQLRELEAGRAFEITLTVPPTAREVMTEMSFTLKSNFADNEIVRVPIVVAGGKNAVTADGIPLTARASRFLSSPQARPLPVPVADDFVPEEDKNQTPDPVPDAPK